MSAFNVKSRRVLLASAARTATTTYAPASKDQFSLGIRFYLNITAASGTGGLKVILRGYDTISNNAVAISTGGTAVTATGLYVWEIYPGVAETVFGNVIERRSTCLPLQWDVQVLAGDGSSYTYSLSGEVLQ